MSAVKRLLIAASAVAALAGCGRESGNSAAAEAGESGVEAGAAEASDPFMVAHWRMQAAMARAEGASASEIFVRKMIEHHRGAIEMSEILLARGGDPNAIHEAQATVESQRREIEALERMLGAGISGGAGPANPFREVEARMNARMMAIHGASPSDTWLRMMIEHHRGAVAMADLILRQGGDPDVLAMARRTVQQQSREIAELERLITGEHQAAEVAKAEAADQDMPPPSSATGPAARPKAPADAPAGHAAKHN